MSAMARTAKGPLLISCQGLEFKYEFLGDTYMQSITSFHALGHVFIYLCIDIDISERQFPPQMPVTARVEPG